MTIQTEIPDLIYRRAVEVAEREHISLDQLISLSLAGQVAAVDTRNCMEARAKRGNWAAFDRFMAKVPDAEPEPHDRL